MNWKKYESLSPAEKRQEGYYIIGLDLGNDSSGMAFYNPLSNAPEAIDLSGGYGKPSIPTVMQYISETKEWVFGEYAMLNRGAGSEITLNALIERLGHFDYIEIDRRSLSVASVLALFIKELLSNVRNINPKAEIVGIVASVPAYFSEQANEELCRAFKLAGYEKELIALVPDRECVLAHYYQTSSPMQEERILLLDFGARELRGGLYHTTIADGGLFATSLSSLFCDEIGVSKINNDVSNFFGDFVRKELVKGRPLNASQSRQLHENVLAFSYQHKDMLFQKNIRAKPIKMYFNFVYPPFQQTITNEQVKALVKPYTRRFNGFMGDVLEKSISETPVLPIDIDAVLCVGGGFEMLWAKEAVGELFAGARVYFYKNPKMVVCEGAAVVAARALNMDSHKDVDFITIVDTHQLTCDIGLLNGTDFLPLVERNAFWWQSHSPKLVLINQEVNGGIELNLCMRTKEGEIQDLTIVQLSGLPPRPKGTTRFEFRLIFVSNNVARLAVRDMGFGDLFPQTEYEFTMEIRIEDANNCL